MAQSTVEILHPLVAKGVPMVVAGGTGAGKSTFIIGLAYSNTVCNYLAMREAHGKGSLINTEIVITDAEDVAPDILYITGTVKLIDVAYFDDDTRFVGGVLFSAAGEKKRGGDYEVKLRKAYDYELKSPANNSLAYKIKLMPEDDKERIFKALLAFDQETILRLYTDAKLLEKERGQKGQYARRQFLELLAKDMETDITKFYQVSADALNQESKRFRDMINRCAVIEDTTNKGWKFHLALDGASDPTIAKYLLQSEAGSREYLFSSLSLVFRGAPWLFQHRQTDALVVGEKSGTPIRALRLVDTMGLFHQKATVEDEFERIIDILANYHTNYLIYVYDTNTDAIAKDAHIVMQAFFAQAKFSTSVIALATKLDLYLSDQANASTGISRFVSSGYSSANRQVLVDNAYQTSLDQQKALEQSFRENAQLNENIHKPVMSKQIVYGLPTSDQTINQLMDVNHCLYQTAVCELIETVCSQMAQSPKIRVIAQKEVLKGYRLSESERNVESIRGSLMDCSIKKLYASTVRACKRRWPQNDIHKSVVSVPNDWGYQNIETKFVHPMGNYGRDLLEQVELNPDCFANPDDQKVFEIVVQATKKSLNRMFLKELYDDANMNGFFANRGIYLPQFKRFQNMLNYVLSSYFPATKVVPTDSTKECMERAIRSMINDIINTQCIVVY